MKEKLIFELSSPGRRGYSLPAVDVPEQEVSALIPQEYLRTEAPELPEVSEVDVVRHFTRLSQQNFGVDTGFYPLGSCTMKYNPKVNEEMARLSGFSRIHPYQPEETVQGALQMMYELAGYLAEVTGMAKVTLQPAAGAHGELTGLKIIKAYHQHRGDTKRTKVIVPDSSHGTNPATAAVAGFKIVEIKSNADGDVDLEALKQAVNEETAALMLTNPSTLGMFETNIEAIAKIVHDAGGLLYYDGANTNAIMGYARPGDMGFDVVHLNLHKTFSTPHGGGGPGAGPVGVKEFLTQYLPKPTVEYNADEDKYYLNYDLPYSIGRMKAFYGNFGVLVKAYTYIRALGAEGLKEATENAVLNANYLKKLVAQYYYSPFDRHCKHEFIVTPKNLKEYGVHTLDIAKRLLDYGFHPPTIYFPLIVEEAMMFEPTETESKETLDGFAEAMAKIAQECKENPELVRTAPHSTVVGRLDEVRAARQPDLRWKKAK
ncbi:aminomethyl-transferring glycine dehydrogenase subunit GcvPB [Zhaonella formicivorans]|uniref:aminomethyl-transferring glycine dehydrogenase subunit GcvPB n=1 Tax=Zhaonella formicivorans TaxID=2528593 RepID=UPI0010DB23E8|nr:aminomethyl-transferring glycine dehydrogenase subunit GcvPB [Zhaonella formicivorans]